MNPEDAVIDAIDALVDEQLAEGPVDDYNVDRYDRCRHCRQSWHGLSNDVGCPGAHARGYQVRAWKQRLLAHPCASQPYMPRSFVDMQAARLRGPLAAIRASAQPPSRPTYQVWRCPTCQTTVPRGQHCACPRNWQRPFLPSQLVREWCTNCMRSVPEGGECTCCLTYSCAYCHERVPMEQECACSPSRFARSLAHLTATSSLGSEAAQIAASGAEIIAQESGSVWAIDSSGPEISVSRVCIRCSRPLGMLHTYTSMDGTSPLCRDCFYYRVENPAQPWIPEAEAWEDQAQVVRAQIRGAGDFQVGGHRLTVLDINVDTT